MSDRRPDPEMPLLAATYRELQGPGSDECPPTEALAALPEQNEGSPILRGEPRLAPQHFELCRAQRLDRKSVV